MIALLRFTAAVISALAMSAWTHAASQPKIQTDTIKPFGDHYLYTGLGTVIGLGANPRASLDGSRRFAMDEEDRGGYRRIMRQNLVSFGRRPR